MKKVAIGGVVAGVLLFGSMALAFWESHPHLRAAHDRVDGAIAELRAANDGRRQYGGHRDRAEQLLHDAQREIHEAAEYADAHP
ncbi:MAG TPA: hypothetical protein VEJ86_04855 [Candidatus Binataceae bacterium]|nr:hypothetical protein [Candidatus Binataceae bacterium]